MSTTLLALARLIAKEFGYLSGTCSAAGTTTTIVDTSADSPFDTGDDDSLLDSAWAKIESDTAGTPLNVGEVRRLKEKGGYTPSTRTVTTASAFTNATTTTQSFAIYLKVPPTRVGLVKGLDEYINDFLRTHKYRHYGLLTLLTDGDMETSGVTNWTATNATRTKITTAGSVGKGKQALQVTTSADNGYVESAAVAVAGSARLLYCVADLAANTGTAKLQLWDKTNGAEIDSVSTTSRAATTLWLDGGNIPSTCHSVAVRLIGTTSGNVAVWDNVSLRPADQMTIALPSWVTKPGQLEHVQYSRDRGLTVTTNVLARDSRELVNVYAYDLTEDFGAANQYRLTIPVVLSDSHAFVVGLRYFAELSADTDTTDADQDWLKAAVLAAVYNDAGESSKAKYWASLARGLDRSPRWSGPAFKAVKF